MSKRKDIEYIHQVTDLSYGEARRLYKENGEDVIKTLRKLIIKRLKRLKRR